MKGLSTFASALLAAAFYHRPCLAQTPYTDSTTGIKFSTWTEGTSGYTFGIALPEASLTKDATEYIGLLRCSTGWCGLSHGESGQMTQALLLVAWPNAGEVVTSFRYATGYNLPEVYSGNATLTQISSKVNDTSFEVIFRCENCFAWNQSGASGSVATSEQTLILGYAQSKTVPSTPSCPDSSFKQHDSFGQYGAPLNDSVNADYTKWAALATKTTSGACSATTTATATTTPTATTTSTPLPTVNCVAPDHDTYDYIVVGSGAGGIPIADRLSEAGHSVLLVEKGPPSSGRYDGTMKPTWLESTNLTRFDVPGLCNQIWVDSAGVACTDTDQMAGCVLGGGTAVNAGLWWKPNPADWDENFPAGWRAKDVAFAEQRAFARIPGTDNPSLDGILYQKEGFDVLSNGFKQAGWKEVKPNQQPTEKNHTYGRTNYMYDHGERGGPMATYLQTALSRSNFNLVMNTEVKRVVRDGGHATGVEIACTGNSGFSKTVNLTAKTGRVILSAGTFGSPKLLYRSGIGPTDQLQIVSNSTDGPTMISENSWINLPVGSNLVDHLNTDVYVTHPDVVFYDFYAAWTDPISGDKDKYLANRTGIFTQAAPNIGPMFWDEVTSSDGKVRQLQYTSRVEGEDKTGTNKTMIMSQYLGRGSTSRGRMAITAQLSTVVAVQPYLHTDGDKEAVLKSLDNLRAALTPVKNLTWALPLSNQTTADYVNSLVVSAAARRSNHWMGTAKMGLDDGRVANGTAVVDLNAKVYGTDNIFVVDASIFPGMPTGNPSAMIVAASEYAAERILKLTAAAARRGLDPPRGIAYRK